MTHDSSDTPPTGETDATPIIRMSDFGAVQPERILAGLRAYWESLRGGGRAIPMRTDVQPHGIREALDYAFILERIAPGAARFRLAGRHLVDLMGMEVRGMPLCSVLNAPSRGRLSDVLETIFKGPQIAELTLTSAAGYGRPELGGRMLLLPLRSDLGDVTRALGCLVSAGDIGRGPRRFDIASDRMEPVIPGARVLDPRPSDHELAEPPAPWRPQFPPALAPLLDRPTAPATPEERRARFRIISADPED